MAESRHLKRMYRGAIVTDPRDGKYMTFTLCYRYQKPEKKASSGFRHEGSDVTPLSREEMNSSLVRRLFDMGLESDEDFEILEEFV